MPPEPLGGEDFATVKVSVDILSILEIAEVDGYITFQIDLILEWYDNRLTFFNLNDDHNLNTLSPEEQNALWIPELIFFNTKDKIVTTNDDKAFTTVTKQDTHRVNSIEELRNAYIYQGSANPITITRTYSIVDWPF